MKYFRSGVDVTGASGSGGFRLSLTQRLAYSVGHVLNDLCASMWFTYLLLFLRQVAQLSNAEAGYLLLWGQVVDALCTPLVGYACDRTHALCGRGGRRMSWHALGTVSVLLSFPFVFSPSFIVEGDTARLLYYSFFIAVFQFGWAATQVSHLSLVPQLTPVDAERVELNSFRNAFTVLSSVAVYAVAWLVFSLNESGDLGASEFVHLMVISVTIGTVFSVVFHAGTSESQASIDARALPITSIKVSDWFKEHQFYLIAVMYMCSRLIVNVSQTYWSLYLTESLKLAKHFIAIVPLVVFGSGFVVSLCMRPLMSAIGRKKATLLGLVGTLVACALMSLITESNALHVLLPALLLGSSGSVLLISSLSMTSDLIGNHSESSAFVFGAMSFTDKLSSGVCIVLIQLYHPCTSSLCCADCVWYYRNVMVLVPAIVAVLSAAILLLLVPMKLGRLRWVAGR